MMREYLGCGDHSCRLEKPTGQGTNGGCRCLKELPTGNRIRVEKFIHRLKEELKNAQK